MKKRILKILLAIALVCSFALVAGACIEPGTGSGSEPGNGGLRSFRIFFTTGISGFGIPPIVAYEGDDIFEPQLPERDGFRFTGWFEEGATEPFVFSYMPSRNIELTARWQQVFSRTISFSTGYAGATLPAQTVEDGSRVTAASLPTLNNRTGFAFGGWRIATVTGPLVTAAGFIADNDVALHANWVAGNTLMLTGEGILPNQFIVAPEGERITAPPTPTRAGHIFRRWVFNDSGTNRIFDFRTMPIDPVTVLQAEWLEDLALPILSIDLRDTAAVSRNTAANIGGNRDFDQNETVPINAVRNPNFHLNGSAAVSGATFGGDSNSFAHFATGNWDGTRDSWVRGSVRLENAGEHNFPNSSIQFRGRGNGSWANSGSGPSGDGFVNGGAGASPLPGYRFRFDGGASNRGVLGMPVNRNWLLVSGTNHDHTSRVRNHTMLQMSYHILDGFEYVARNEMVELVVNGEYRGIYMLIEHARVADGRVPTRAIGSHANGFSEDTGWLVEMDARATGAGSIDAGGPVRVPRHARFWANENSPGVATPTRPFEIIYPDPDDVARNPAVPVGTAQTRDNNPQMAHFMTLNENIRTQMSDLARAISNNNEEMFHDLADIDSFVDMYIIEELAMNNDFGHSSLFFYRRPFVAGSTLEDGRIRMGTPWDLEMQFRGNNTGLYVAAGSGHSNVMFVQLMQRSWFRAAVRARWQVVEPQMRTFITTGDGVLSDNWLERVGTSFGRERAWRGNWRTNLSNIDSAQTAWRNGAISFRNELLTRMTWFNDNMNSTSVWG